MYIETKYMNKISNSKKTYKESMDISIIKNITLEPIIDKYITYYFNFYSIAVKTNFFDFPACLSFSLPESDTIIILSMREIDPKLYFNILFMTNDEINMHLSKIKDILTLLINTISKNQNIIFFKFENMHGKDIYNEYIQYINNYLEDITNKRDNFILLDRNLLINYIGLSNVYDMQKYFSFGLYYSTEMCNIFASYIVKNIIRKGGYMKKCLVLDCDDILWGGVIVDDGFNGIKLNQQSSGRAYQELQYTILELHAKGILIGLCSKNDEDDVWKVFESHEGMILKKEHIAVAEISWNDKVTGLKRISEKLNISLDSIVFIDDNHYEINLINYQLPEVCTILFDRRKPHQYSSLLSKYDFFVKVPLTKEAKSRTVFYQQQRKRNEYKKEFKDINSFEEFLHTRVIIKLADIDTLPRIAELTQRTNQFNLSSRHYSLDELAKINKNPDHEILFLNASDIFGDLGIVAAAIIHYSNDCVLIKDFMVSCRVFSRKFEYQLLDNIYMRAANKNIISIKGIYHYTEKNKKFANFYQDNGVMIFEE